VNLDALVASTKKCEQRDYVMNKLRLDGSPSIFEQPLNRAHKPRLTVLVVDGSRTEFTWSTVAMPGGLPMPAHEKTSAADPHGLVNRGEMGNCQELGARKGHLEGQYAHHSSPLVTPLR
jgi:hypothetical protein